MGEIKVIVFRVLSVLLASLCIIITAFNMDSSEVEVNGVSYIVGELAPTYCYMLSDNVCITTINGMSNVYLNMEHAGYTVYRENVTRSYIDVIFIKDGSPAYRYYYTTADGRLTFFCDNYENSFTGLSYINDKKD